MIELFTRKTDAIQLPNNAILTPLHVDENISSLSAILLDDEYYSFLRSGKMIVDGVTILGPAYLIPFKAKAWLDLSKQRLLGEQIDSKNIRKHKNDVFRLTDLINSNIKIQAPEAVVNDMHIFVEMMREENIDLKQLGIVGRNKEAILEELKNIYTKE
jgi:hypothetical protein